MRFLVPLAFAATVLSAQTPAYTTLSELRDHHRVLLIFAPSPNDPQLEIQLRTLNEHAADVSERDLIPIALPYNAPSPTAVTFSPAAADAARRQFVVPPNEFTVILIGKDGGEKLRSHKPLPHLASQCHHRCHAHAPKRDAQTLVLLSTEPLLPILSQATQPRNFFNSPASHASLRVEYRRFWRPLCVRLLSSSPLLSPCRSARRTP